MQVIGYEGLYEITEAGVITNCKTGKEVKQSRNTRGYIAVNLKKNKVQKRSLVHRLVAINYLPNPDNLSQVDHKDEDKLHNHFSNLRWCTNKENSCWFADNNPNKVRAGNEGKEIMVDTKWFISAWAAAQYIVSCNPGKNVKTISKELRRYLKGERNKHMMYGKHSIGF